MELTSPLAVYPRAIHCLSSKCLLRRDDFLPLLAKFLDAERHHIAGLEEHGLGFHAEADTGRGAGDDDVTRLHHEEL